MKFDEYLDDVKKCLLENYHLSQNSCVSLLGKTIEDILYFYEKGYSKEEVLENIISVKETNAQADLR